MSFHLVFVGSCVLRLRFFAFCIRFRCWTRGAEQYVHPSSSPSPSDFDDSDRDVFLQTPFLTSSSVWLSLLTGCGCDGLSTFRCWIIHRVRCRYPFLAGLVVVIAAVAIIRFRHIFAFSNGQRVERSPLRDLAHVFWVSDGLGVRGRGSVVVAERLVGPRWETRLRVGHSRVALFS